MHGRAFFYHLNHKAPLECQTTHNYLLSSLAHPFSSPSLRLRFPSLHPSCPRAWVVHQKLSVRTHKHTHRHTQTHTQTLRHNTKQSLLTAGHDWKWQKKRLWSPKKKKRKSGLWRTSANTNTHARSEQKRGSTHRVASKHSEINRSNMAQKL